MKKAKIGLLAAATIIGIGGAYASKHNNTSKFLCTTYYAVTNGTGGFSWTTIAPSLILFVCVSHSLSYCTIVTNCTGYIPTDNSAPDLSRVIAHSNFNGIWAIRLK